MLLTFEIRYHLCTDTTLYPPHILVGWWRQWSNNRQPKSSMAVERAVDVPGSFVVEDSSTEGVTCVVVIVVEVKVELVHVVEEDATVVLGISVIITVFGYPGTCVLCILPVSYTHLDVYKRQV